MMHPCAFVNEFHLKGKKSKGCKWVSVPKGYIELWPVYRHNRTPNTATESYENWAENFFLVILHEFWHLFETQDASYNFKKYEDSCDQNKRYGSHMEKLQGFDSNKDQSRKSKSAAMETKNA